MELPFQLALRTLRSLFATVAMLAFLLYGTATAAPTVEDGGDEAICVAADVQLCGGPHAEHPDTAGAHGSCCGATCSFALLPTACQIAVAFFRAGGGPESAQRAAGIEPEGLRRPPRPAA